MVGPSAPPPSPVVVVVKKKQQPQQPQQKQLLHRFYIGNLPDHVTKDDVERFLLTATATTRKSGAAVVPATTPANTASITLVVDRIGQRGKNNNNNNKTTTTFAIVSTSRSTLPSHLQYQGRLLTVQPADGGGFGSSSWAKPKSSLSSSSPHHHHRNMVMKEPGVVVSKNKKTDKTASQQQQSKTEHDNNNDDGHVASAAASPCTEEAAVIVFENTHAQQTLSSSSTPFDVLLADYGERDPKWHNMLVDHVVDDKDDAYDDLEEEEDKGDGEMTRRHPPGVVQQQHRETINLLGIMGKAPLHVNICTFGHVHGRPHGYNNKNSAVEDLLTYDCDDDYADIIPRCPPYLDFLDGQAFNVKRAIVNGAVRSLSKRDIAPAIIAQLFEANNTFHYGYHNPHQMTVYIGSQQGRHRSVVLAELVATAVRQLLRQADPEQWGHYSNNTCTVSVGCTHRDIHKKACHRGNSSAAEKARQKQEADEDEKEIKARRLPQRAVRW